MLITPLIRYYMNLGLVVTKIYQFVEYTPSVCFKSFVSDVVSARREGDTNRKSSVVAETMKLLGNSSYGYQIMDRTKFTDTVYCSSETVDRAINRRTFRKLEEVTSNVFEVNSARNKIEHREPIIVGFFILQYAKLRMLELYYNFFDRFCDKNMYEELEMDTDSLYLALGAESIDDIIGDSDSNIDNALTLELAESWSCGYENYEAHSKLNFSHEIVARTIRSLMKGHLVCSKKSLRAQKWFACAQKHTAVSAIRQ